MKISAKKFLIAASNCAIAIVAINLYVLCAPKEIEACFIILIKIHCYIAIESFIFPNFQHYYFWFFFLIKAPEEMPSLLIKNICDYFFQSSHFTFYVSSSGFGWCITFSSLSSTNNILRHSHIRFHEL